MTAAFWIIAIIVTAGAFGAVTVTNLMHSVLLLAVTLIGLAGLYITLMADFVAAIQVMIYVGAVVIILIFGIMLIHRGNMFETNMPGRHLGIGTLASFTVAGLLIYAVSNTAWPLSTEAPAQQTVDTLAHSLFTVFVVPFEVAGVLLLVAVIGAIILAKEVGEK